MGSKLYVGNLPYGVRDHDLEQAFIQFGSVASAKVMMERETGRSKGFGFVEMSSEEQASAAIQGMNGQPLGGRSLVVNVARPMEPRAARPFNSAYNGGGYNAGGANAGYAGRSEGGFRSPYGTGARNRNYGATSEGGQRFRNSD